MAGEAVLEDALAAHSVAIAGGGFACTHCDQCGDDDRRPAECHARDRYCVAVVVRITRRRSVPDSAAHVSPLRPSIWRTSEFGLSLGKLSNFSVAGSNRTMLFEVQSLSQTLSSGSTHTA